MFDNIKEIWFTSKLKGQCKITESLLLTDPQVNSIRECTRILKNNCLNFLPALIEDYDVTSDACINCLVSFTTVESTGSSTLEF